MTLTLNILAHYIIFPWANGGTLRNFWAADREAHIDLSRERVKEFLEQFSGLAGALCQLHGTNTRTVTGFAEAAWKRRASPKHVSSSNSKPQSSFSEADGPRNASLSDTDNTPGNVPSSEDKDNDIKHWRHGDLKPENILVFKNATWLGNLKIADLGLARQHQFATESRHQVTSTKHATLHYKAPEAVTNMQEPRSRRYDVWSMGCIILESIIWLLYGSHGLDQFYLEYKRFQGHTRQTLYFTTSSRPTSSGSQLVANVSDIAIHWITEILEKDPECSGYTAIRQLLELVRDRLLVVAIPSKARPDEAIYRATSVEVYRKIDHIRRTASQDDEYLFTGTDRRQVKIPSPFNLPTKTIISKPMIVQPQGHLGVSLLSAHDLSQHTMVSVFNVPLNY